jgi:hypothetical protein
VASGNGTGDGCVDCPLTSRRQPRQHARHLVTAIAPAIAACPGAISAAEQKLTATTVTIKLPEQPPAEEKRLEMLGIILRDSTC